MHWRRRLVDDIVNKMLAIVLTDIDSTKTRPVIVDVKFESIPVQGFCMDCDDGEYEIIMNRNQSKKELIVNMCHELVHVMQSERGDKFYYDKPYSEQEHEIEAYNKQEIYADVYERISS